MRKETLAPVDLLDVLLDPDNHDPIRCVAEDGTMIEFEQVGVISLPAGYLFAFVCGWGIAGIWMAFPFGLTSAGVMYYLRFRYKVRKGV